MKEQDRSLDDDAELDELLASINVIDDGSLDIEIAAERLFGQRSPLLQIDRFSVSRVVGRGGMGVVYAAHDPVSACDVAIKLVGHSADDAGTRDDARARLLREARVASRLRHPNIVTVHEHGVHDGCVFLVMELIDGIPFDHWLAAEQRGWTEILEVLLGAGEGLAVAHAAGIVHRDFKPGNVLVDRKGAARVVDFGLARPFAAGELVQTSRRASHTRSFHYSITATGKVGGTRRYMAPELFSGAVPAPTADVYAYCVVLADAWRASTTNHERDQAADKFVDAMLRGLDPDPSARWQGMRELLDALKRHAARRGWRP
jgi:serine/threonine protein kinase